MVKLKPPKLSGSLYVPLGLIHNNFTFCAQNALCVCFVWISEQNSDYSPTRNDFNGLYRVRQKYLTILQNSSEWNRWRG